MPSYIARADGVVVRYDDSGIITSIPPNTNLPEYQDYLTWRDTTSPNEEGLIAAARAALVSNADDATQDQAITDKADNMLAFAGSSLTQAQIIQALKDLAQGVKILTEHDVSCLAQRNKLIKLQVGDYS